MQEIKKPTHGSQEWLDLRHRTETGMIRFGASEAPTLMGVNKYETLTDLAIAKWSDPEPLPPNDAMTRGNVLEPSLVAWAADVIGQPVVTPDVMYANGRLIATLDGLSADGKVIVEAKTTTAYSSDDVIPDAYYWQATAQLACYPNADEVLVVVLDKRMRLGFWRVLRNDENISLLIEQADAVGDYLDRNELPPLATVTEKHAKVLWPNPEGSVELGSDGLAALEEWQAWKQRRDEVEKQEQDARDRLVAKIGNAEFGTVDGVAVVSYKSRKGSARTDFRALEKDHPGLLDQYKIAGAPTRVLKGLL